MRVHLLVTPMRKKNLAIRPLRLGGFPSHLRTFLRPRTTCTICFTVKSTPIAESSRYLKAAHVPPRRGAREQWKGREEGKEGMLHGKLRVSDVPGKKNSDPASGRAFPKTGDGFICYLRGEVSRRALLCCVLIVVLRKDGRTQ